MTKGNSKFIGAIFQINTKLNSLTLFFFCHLVGCKMEPSFIIANFEVSGLLITCILNLSQFLKILQYKQPQRVYILNFKH